jgi:hypothetical protein
MDSNTIYLVLNYECREPETRMAERFWYTIQWSVQNVKTNDVNSGTL